MTSESFDPSNEAIFKEDLVAYLDGELPSEDTRRIEELMATDPRIRLELQRLERTWELLDRLPKVEVERSFTSSTVEMIALSAEADANRRAPSRRRTRFLTLATMVAAFVLGFLAVSWLKPDPNRQFLRDLHVVESLDAYQQTGDIDFLRQLKAEGLFPPEGTDEH